MPKTKGPGPATKTLAPLAPLALALLVGSAVIPNSGTKPVTNPSDPTASASCEDGLENFTECHSTYPTGCSPSGRYDGYLNVLKNQEPPRESKPLRVFTSMTDYTDLESRTPKELGKSNHLDLKDQLTAMGEGRPHAVIGYLYYAKQEGAESSNCELTSPDDTDYHIGIGFDKTLTKAQAAKATKTAVVVEMTPQYRANLAPDWTLPALKAVLTKQVKVTGQLMADNEHNVTKDNCGLPGAGSTCWRASIWELHPVTSFQVCNKDTECTADDAAWVDLEKFGESPAPAKKAAP
jgi:hypothetical protein